MSPGFPKRKYKVFISSSFEDLKDHRNRLMLKTLKLGHIPAGMELFQPGESQSLDVIEKEILSSDIFVILVGAALGSPIDNSDTLTYTMKEFEIAEQAGLPIIPFLLNDVEFTATRDNIPSSRQRDRDQEATLRRFREDVKTRLSGGKRFVGFFSYLNIDELCDQYSGAIRTTAEELTEGGRTSGWVHGKLYDELNARIALGSSVSKNPFFASYARRLSTFDKLSQRTQVDADLKTRIADYFWEQYMPQLDEHSVSHIYFESGSAVAYVSRKFIEYVNQEDWIRERDLPGRLKIRTNNLLTYLDFLLVDEPWKPMDIRLQPYGPFSHDYGATYGRLKAARKLPPPSQPVHRNALPGDASKVVEEVRQDLLAEFNERGLVLMTTSGVDVNPESPFLGPHVGSYYNMLLKRCLLSLPCPKVLFLDQTKWDFPFLLHNCHPVCDAEFPWNAARETTPLAIALSVRDRERRDFVLGSLESNGFRHAECGEVKTGVKGVWPIIAANDLFWKFFHPQESNLIWN